MVCEKEYMPMYVAEIHTLDFYRSSCNRRSLRKLHDGE